MISLRENFIILILHITLMLERILPLHLFSFTKKQIEKSMDNFHILL